MNELQTQLAGAQMPQLGPDHQSFDEHGLQFAWDSTSIKLADECLRKYYYKMVEGWQPRDTGVHLVFGAHFATALEHYYKWVATGDSSETALAKVILECLINTWEHEVNEKGERIPGTGKPVEFLHNSKTRENLIRSCIWYVDQFENESIEVVKLASGKPAVEYSFSLPVDNDIVFTGHIDRLVTYSDEIYAMDQKTTGQTVSSAYFAQYSPDHQMSMYTFAGQMIYGSPVKGVIIDVAQIAVGFTRFERGFTFRTSAQLAEWYEDAMYTIEAARSAVREQHFPMRRTSCNNFGGCEFRSVCGRSPDVRPNFLAADFVRGPRWDPLQRR